MLRRVFVQARRCQSSLLLSTTRRSISLSYWKLVDETIKCPALAESITEGDLKWVKQEGESVEMDETVCEIETDKTAIQVHASNAGVLKKWLISDGEPVTPGSELCVIDVGAEGTTAAAAPTPKQEDSPPQPSPAESQPTAAPSQPEKQPLVLKTIETSSFQPPRPPPAAASAQLQAGLATIGLRTESRVKMNRMRMTIANRLKESQNTNAMLTTFNEIDCSNIKQLRSKYVEAFQKKYGIKLGYMSAFVKAASQALVDQPIVNAVIDGNEIVYRDYVDVSIAVASPKGLVVPVLRNVENMNYAQIEMAIHALGEKARTGQLAIEDTDGGTFTVSNGGVFGSMLGTPIINPPQSAILGMHAMVDRPVVVDGQIVIRPVMYVALTYDHRLIDGREAVTFLRKIKSCVEDPRSILLDL